MTVSLHRFSEEFKRSFSIAPLCKAGFQYVAFVIHGAPQMVRLAVDLNKPHPDATASSAMHALG